MSALRVSYCLAKSVALVVAVACSASADACAARMIAEVPGRGLLGLRLAALHLGERVEVGEPGAEACPGGRAAWSRIAAAAAAATSCSAWIRAVCASDTFCAAMMTCWSASSRSSSSRISLSPRAAMSARCFSIFCSSGVIATPGVVIGVAVGVPVCCPGIVRVPSGWGREPMSGTAGAPGPAGPAARPRPEVG